MGLTEETAADWIGRSKEEMPDDLTSMFDAFDSPCPECNENMVAFAPEGIDSECVCFGCGAELRSHDVDNMFEVAKEKVDNHIETRGERKEAMSKGEYKREGNKNLAKMLGIIGILFCLTIIGIPIGAVLIYLAARIAPDEE